MITWNGYCGKILDINLTTGSIKPIDLEEKDILNYLGGAGLNAWLLFKNTDAHTDPLSPDNPLIFGAGPIVGAGFPCAARSTFTTLSPLTNLFGDANGGGHFEPGAKRAGYDHLIIPGASNTPCYLLIQPNTCSIEDASDLWGKDASQTDQILTNRHKGSLCATIGKAGEQRVRYANILTHDTGNSWSRTGVGCVMGSKKLKAIVVKGKEKIPVSDADFLKTWSKTIKEEVDTGYGGQLFAKNGTMPQITGFSAKGFFYRKNGREKATLIEASKIATLAFNRNTEHKRHGCYRCPIMCEKEYTITSGKYKGEKGHKYELGYGACLGFNVGIEDITAVLHLATECNKAGVDLIEFSSVAALAIDLFKEGILTESNTGGIKLDWNSPEVVEYLLNLTVEREGLGNILAEGTKKAAEIIGKGADNYVQHMKGMTEPAHSCPPFLLSFAVATRGGDHLKGMPILCIANPNLDTIKNAFNGTKNSKNLYTHEDNGRTIWWHENFKTVVDSFGPCFFLISCMVPMGFLLPEDLATIYTAATGIEMDAKRLMMTGERAYQVEKAINSLRGVDRSTDTFTTRQEKHSWGKGIDLDHPGNGTAGLPHVIQRFYVVPNPRDARWSVVWGLFFICIVYWTAPVYAVFGKVLAANPEVGALAADAIVVYTAQLGNIHPLIVGLLAAGGVSASFSTVSGLLVTGASAFSHDLYVKVINPEATARKQLLVARL
ncbi:MAG: aldehyde ferredoxin oxidoreductase C-terminal domain-containing protein, partial [Candidatus Desulfacyla sp.]